MILIKLNKGVTNPGVRDKLPRSPVFIISKYFVHGKNLKSGIFHNNQLRPYSSRIPIGPVSQTKINFTEIGAIAGVTKDIAKLSFKRIISNLARKFRSGEVVYFDIPHLGVLTGRNNVIGVKFHDFLINDTKVKPSTIFSYCKDNSNKEFVGEEKDR